MIRRTLLVSLLHLLAWAAVLALLRY